MGIYRFHETRPGKKLRIMIEGELNAMIDRILAKPRGKINQALLQDHCGQTLTYFARRSRFDKAREKAGVSF